MTTQGRSAALDGLRGLAAVAVVFYHAILDQSAATVAVLDPPIQGLTSYREAATKIALTVANGQSAVLLFFVLSGFVLKHSLSRATGSTLSICREFVVRRLCRLYPAIIFCMVFCFALGSSLTNLPWFAASPHLAAAANPHLVLLNATLAKITMHGATWTLQAEVLAVPFVLLAFFVGRKWGVLGASICLAISVMAIESPFLALNLPNMSGVLFAFMAGILLAETKSATFNEQAVWIAVGFFLFARLVVPMHSTTATISQTMLACCLVYAAFSARAGLFYDLLNARSLRFLGRISFSLYLLNVPVMWVVGALIKDIGFSETNPLEMGILLGVVTTALTLPIADFSERWFEQGGVRLGRYLTRRRAMLPDVSSDVVAAPAE
ncbi:acyltransferase [Mesorhizobium sp. B2-2-1]|uniref:acyltransferase family protein n=1 Tax=Mesorhizobium sp. B2-2-1 TaxID=2589965 RepID=UPI00112865D5|nr:acyltransferase [Mesorhizobium sp. B2-2-1]TPM62079.1 acyltransferase [Mesorhizobium sp. B2-2-1]